jgi:hypothetical protein
MRVATIVDVDALWHVAVYSVLGALGLVTAYGTAVLALDRIERPATGGGPRAGWTVVIAVAGLACVGLLAVGLWAMAQK